MGTIQAIPNRAGDRHDRVARVGDLTRLIYRICQRVLKLCSIELFYLMPKYTRASLAEVVVASH